MKPDPLQRLLAAARRCPSRPIELPWGVETRVLAQWRSLGSPEVFWLGLLRRGLLASLAMAAGSLILYMYLPKAPSQNELVLADTMIQTQLWP
jgi:hypothetical protein